MLTASPQISGPAIADAGAAYSLSLAANSNTTVNSWAINWGDGSGVNHLSGNPSSATHVFSAAGSYDVTGSVTDGDGTYSANDKPLSVYPTSAAYVGSDSTTLGTWVGTYGAEGSYIPEYGSNLPAYAQLTSSGQQEGVWQFYSMDTRAPVQTPGTWRIAAYDSSEAASAKLTAPSSSGWRRLAASRPVRWWQLRAACVQLSLSKHMNGYGRSSLLPAPGRSSPCWCRCRWISTGHSSSSRSALPPSK